MMLPVTKIATQILPVFKKIITTPVIITISIETPITVIATKIIIIIIVLTVIVSITTINQMRFIIIILLNQTQFIGIITFKIGLQTNIQTTTVKGMRETRQGGIKAPWFRT